MRIITLLLLCSAFIHHAPAQNVQTYQGGNEVPVFGTLIGGKVATAAVTAQFPHTGGDTLVLEALTVIVCWIDTASNYHEDGVESSPVGPFAPDSFTYIVPVIPGAEAAWIEYETEWSWISQDPFMVHSEFRVHSGPGL